MCEWDSITAVLLSTCAIRTIIHSQKGENIRRKRQHRSTANRDPDICIQSHDDRSLCGSISAAHPEEREKHSEAAAIDKGPLNLRSFRSKKFG